MVYNPSASSSSLPDANSGAVYRLVRTLSGRSGKGAPGEQGIIGDAPAVPLKQTISATSASSNTAKKRRLSVGDRLKQLGKELPLGKLRKVAGYGKAGLASPRMSADGTLPATADEDRPPRTPATSSPGAGPSSSHAKMLSMVAELDEPASTIVGSPTVVATPSEDRTPTAQTLARRIQDLVDAPSLPIFPPLAVRTSTGQTP
ncbi:hypothetical protein NLJ89_g4376 [Agrocybe chaxingu]|uniref:Uncharacterized protein n=1 Tax=Agrocybe chaxingu TaxID=84603 RepID=A0A9W8MWK9_9AGAR|nr:hypothetical protein NLJ89_g4376 [Agrocybe chaxingu]